MPTLALPQATLALLRATHLAPSLVVTAIGTALAVLAGRGWGTLGVAAAVLAGQFSIGWGNDWLDRERDAASARADKPIVRGEIAASTVLRAAIVALALCVPLSLLPGLRAGAVHLLAVGAGWAYNLWFKRSLASPVAYAVGFGLLPAFVTLGLPGQPLPRWWVMAAGALLGAGAHFANALPDLDEDRRAGLRALPHALGARASAVLAAALLAAGAGVVLAGAGALPAVGLTFALAAAVLVAAAAGRLRLAFPLAMAAAGTLVAALLAAGGSLT